MRELTNVELESVEGGILVTALAVAALYVGALTIVQSMGTSSGEANARRTAEAQ